MKKLMTFCIVLTIQIGIIYGLYKWYVSYDSNSLNAQRNVTVNPTKDTTITNKGDNSVQKKVTIEQKSNSRQIAHNGEAKQIPPSDKNNIEYPKINNFNNSLIYKDAVWGNIPSLKRSNMAKTGILVDINNQTVLWAKKSRKSVPIASMTKMMTVLLALEEIENKNSAINLDTIIPVTNEAYKIGGSQVYLDPREKFPIKELLKTMMISSANDSSYLIAQYIGGGDVNVFVKSMNKRAKEINMPKAHFSNPDGLPEKYSAQDNMATAEGLVFLATRLLQYPLVRKLATTRLAYFRENTKKPMMLVNTNRLVREKFNGITGLKTGYTRRSGFCLTATCKRGKQSLIAVVTGFQSNKERNEFVKNLLNWGYNRLASDSTEKNK